MPKRVNKFKWLSATMEQYKEWFSLYVNRTDTCWIWTGRTCRKFREERKTTPARMAWLIAHGSLPSDGKEMRRSCKNLKCVNPDHLYLGTPQDSACAYSESERIEVFWSQVNKSDGCWEWTGCKERAPFDYGTMGVRGKVVKTHRFSWMLHYGPIPDGLCVCHKCDNPRCVRPDHLFLGTLADNNHDRNAKGRWKPTPPLGENNGNSILMNSDVVKIREMARSGVSRMEIASKFGLALTHVGKICRGDSWRHLL